MNMKGSLPLLVLQVLGNGPRHGYRIAKDIRERSEGVLDFAEGTLYPALHDLEQRGLVDAFEEEVKGRTRRCYRLTDAGHAALVAERAEWDRYRQAVAQVLGSAL